jgi:hypothetical protein
MEMLRINLMRLKSNAASHEFGGGPLSEMPMTAPRTTCPNALLARSWRGPHDAPLDPVASRISETQEGTRLEEFAFLAFSPCRAGFTHPRAGLISLSSAFARPKLLLPGRIFWDNVLAERSLLSYKTLEGVRQTSVGGERTAQDRPVCFGLTNKVPLKNHNKFYQPA